MQFMDILRKCDIPDVINQKQHFVPVFLFYVSMFSMWAPSRWQHNRTRSRKLAPTLSAVSADTLPTYQFIDAKSQLLPSPGAYSRKPWHPQLLAAVSCGRLRCLADGLPDFLDFVTISRHHWWPTRSHQILSMNCPLFLKVMYVCTIREMTFVYGVSEALQPYSRRKLCFTETNDLVTHQNFTIFIFSSAEKTIADSDLIFWYIICLNITYLVWPKFELSLKKQRRDWQRDWRRDWLTEKTRDFKVVTLFWPTLYFILLRMVHTWGTETWKLVQ